MMMGLMILVAAGFFAAERFWPARELPSTRGWWARILVVNVTQVGVVLLAGITWERWVQGASLFHASETLGDAGAAVVAYLVSCFVYYWWHRVRHESKLFWRLCHQLHHSPRRIELLASFYKHPVEITLNSLISCGIVYLLLGCSLKAAAMYTFMTALAEYFYHWNVRTPRWLGWFIQRPESHRVHHEHLRHTRNYADLPVLDWLFGTLENPQREVKACGFDEEREARFGEMLAFRDVHEQPPLPPLAPTCLGCAKRWICQAVRKPQPAHDN